jgi:Zn-dependent protease with chaperone function
MRAIVTVCVLAVAALASWVVASVLSPDAIGMAVGLLFGVLAGIPTALLVMASNRRRPYTEDELDAREERYSRQAPVVILYPPQPSQPSRYITGYSDEHEELFDTSPQTPRRIALQPEPATRKMRNAKWRKGDPTSVAGPTDRRFVRNGATGEIAERR